MNPVFIGLVILIAIVLWFLLAFVFRPLGKFLFRIGSDAYSEMTKEDENNKNKGE